MGRRSGPGLTIATVCPTAVARPFAPALLCRYCARLLALSVVAVRPFVRRCSCVPSVPLLPLTAALLRRCCCALACVRCCCAVACACWCCVSRPFAFSVDLRIFCCSFRCRARLRAFLNLSLHVRALRPTWHYLFCPSFASPRPRSCLQL